MSPIPLGLGVRLRARTFHTSAYATASARDSWRNLRDGASLLRKAVLARHRSVRRPFPRALFPISSKCAVFSVPILPWFEAHLQNS